MIQNRALDKLRTFVASDNPSLVMVGVLIVCLGVGVAVGALFGGFGPIIALALIGVGCAGYLMIRSTQWGLIALVGWCSPSEVEVRSSIVIHAARASRAVTA